jgi:hypothetical protein
MSSINQVIPGYTGSLWVQDSANTPLSLTNLSIWADHVEEIVGTVANGTGTDSVQLNVEAIPPFGQDDAVANYMVAGSRQSDKIPTQSAPTSQTITAAWNPSDAGLLQIQADALSGLVERTYVAAFVVGDDTDAYAFNARVSQFQIDAQPGAEAKCVFTIHPRGNMYGWSYNT